MDYDGEIIIRRFARCNLLLTRALIYFQLLGNAVGEAEVRCKLSALHYLRHQPEESVRWAMGAMELHLGDRPRLAGALSHNIARGQIDLGNLDLAEPYLDVAMTLQNQFTSFESSYPIWTLGLLLLERGDSVGAQAQLLAATSTLQAGGHRLEAAAASCDLARSYLRQGDSRAAHEAVKPYLDILNATDLSQNHRLYVDRLREESARA